MKKIIVALFVATLMLGGTSAFAAVDCTKDSPIDQVGDWFATLGKDGMEKNAVLAERKANRVAACAKREAEKAAKKVQQAGSDMKKKMGF
ncbi:MAG: hypothetical protein BWY44_00365 [Candidatus Omnitrophica bacterium ADurb.Bin292]|jgi:hypothetical protein|nr:MAG: hypothetical protein BWY44_00365 [Candidatus Omnitrophica bacterium ADurb.Bin292]HPW77203.1 hypothetical protein [Candidatus Omnitrophota bacterium]HQB12229.1 hypothetical protein [Candidatus Omnitrophota bacterium]